MKIEDFQGRHTGERCVIVANGPSLLDVISKPDVVKRVMKFGTVIGVNRSFEAFPSDYHVVPDHNALLNYGRLIPETKGLFTRHEIRRRDAITIKSLPNRDLFSLDLREGWVIQGASGGALQVAAWMGFRTAVFLGLDLKPTRLMLHFYDKRGRGGQAERRVDFTNQIRWMDRARVFLNVNKPEITVFNTAKDSEACWPHVDFDKIF
jgi:hypothetical protein